GSAMGAMATDNPVESLQEEATCSICLEYFKDSMTIDCGHNFCRTCIAQCWERPDTDVSYPQCRESVQQGNKPQAEQFQIPDKVVQFTLGYEVWFRGGGWEKMWVL
uniref:RING-type domain-containing protein n=1 Tax=Gopherus agassizii TaxID=38772 RepID=A0A452HYZ1_9SAUR